MGQCYSVTLRVHTEDLETMRIKLMEMAGDYSYSSMDKLISDLFFGGNRVYNSQITDLEWRGCFDQAYAYHSHMEDSFKRLFEKGCIKDGSSLVIYPDTGVTRIQVKNGNLVSSDFDMDMSPYFEDIDEVQDYLGNADLWNEKTGAYLFRYGDDGSVCKYVLDKDYAKKISKEAGEESWSAYLGAGGEVIPAEDVEEVIGNSILGSEDWIPATQFAFN